MLAKTNKETKAEGLVTRYSIDLHKQNLSTEEALLGKDRRVPDRQDLEMIYEVSMILMHSFDVQEVCEKIMQVLFNCLKRIDSGLILLKDPQSGELKPLLARSRSSSQNIKLRYSRTIVKQVIREDKAIMMTDMGRKGKMNLSDSIEALGIKSIMCMPLMNKSGIQGAFYLHSVTAHKGFREEDLRFLVCLGMPAAMAIENAQLYTERLKIKQALQESEEKYRALMKNANSRRPDRSGRIH